jgi:hypothetical protein
MATCVQRLHALLAYYTVAVSQVLTFLLHFFTDCLLDSSSAGGHLDDPLIQAPHGSQMGMADLHGAMPLGDVLSLLDFSLDSGPNVSAGLQACLPALRISSSHYSP